MATQSIGYVGERVNIALRQGGTFGPCRVTIKNPDGTPADVTGTTLVGHIRRKALDADTVAILAGEIAGDPLLGVFTFGLSATQTAALPAGETTTDPLSQYVWDMEWTDALGRVIPLYYGAVSVLREVTRA